MSAALLPRALAVVLALGRRLVAVKVLMLRLVVTATATVVLVLVLVPAQ